MSVGLILITHPEIGQAMYNAISHTFAGELPIKTSIVSVTSHTAPETLGSELKLKMSQDKNPNGTLVITDLVGSTPSNIASCLCAENTIVLSGLNLPMLIRIMNYPTLPLKELSEKALCGGQKGICNLNQLSLLSSVGK